MQTVYEQLQEQVVRVHRARARHEALRAEVVSRRAAFEADNAPTIEEMKVAEADVNAREHALRALTVSHFNVTGETTPVPGVAVKLFTTLDYDPVDAFQWAQEKGLAIKPPSLDTKAFEKVVAALPEKPAFVRTIQTPNAQIKSDLSAVVGAVAV